MAAIELWSERGRDRVITLTASSYVVGSDPTSAVIVVDDAAVSRVHAVFERVGTTWLVRDVGSRNGTQVEGERLTGQRRLHNRDEVVVGRTRLVFCDGADARRPATDALEAPPDNLTRMERRVLIELCRPMVSHNSFHQPSSVREMAARLFIGKNAVQAHLSNLYDKFGIYDEGDVNRRLVLAHQAMQRGAVKLADLDERQGDEAGGHG